jgi:hypothetical protein
VLTVLLLAPLLFTSCGPGYTTTAGSAGYTELTVKRGIARFSFEYPSHYRIGKVEIRNDYHYIDVIIYEQSPGDEDPTTLIDVFVIVTGESLQNIQDSIDADLSVASKRPYFRFLERFPVKITADNMPGEKITYSWAIYPDVAPTTEPLHYISSAVFFEYGSRIWSIHMRSDIGGAEADKAVYNHILQTFRILD